MNLKQLLNSTPELQVMLSAPEPDYVGAAVLINAIPMVQNTEPQQQIPVAPTLQDVLGLVTPQERFAIGETKAYDRILEAVSLNRFEWVIDNLTTLLADGEGILSQASYDNLLAALNNPNPQTIPDPTYQELVPGRSLAQENGLIGINAGQVMLAWSELQAEENIPE